MNDSLARADKPRGVLITFEGGEGAGKSTHIRLLATALRKAGRNVVVLREPGGTEIGEILRDVVLDASRHEIADETELLIYEAARAQIVSEKIKPALQAGFVVLCDRFTDSTIAYQAYGRGLSKDFAEAANEFACQGVSPNRTILMRTGGSIAVGLHRATKDACADRIESAGVSFHERVEEGFAELAAAHPARIRIVESSGTKYDTCLSVIASVEDLFPDIVDLSSFACSDQSSSPCESEGSSHHA